MGQERQNNQREVDFRARGEGEARASGIEEAETTVANVGNESPRYGTELMEEICKRTNIREAMERVIKNGGAPGVDGMYASQLRGHLNKHWTSIRQALLEGSYRPLPVRGVEIPKLDGGKRLLGIPTVMDRLVQQAGLQVLQPKGDGTVSALNHGVPTGHRPHD